MTYHINCVNWPASFPEKPEVSVEVRNDHEWLYLHYRGKLMPSLLELLPLLMRGNT